MWLYSSGHTEISIDQRLRPAQHEIERMGKCNGSPNLTYFPSFGNSAREQSSGENNAVHSHAFIALSTRFNRCFCKPSTGRRSRQNVANDISGWISGFCQWACRIFTGNVRVDRLFPANDAAPFSGAYVTFEPGARSAWHTHPTGQHLIVTAGVGRTQAWGGPIEEIKAGDVIWCPPQVKHWHGASPTTAMTHIALTGTINGKNVEWMEQVTDEQYHGK